MKCYCCKRDIEDDLYSEYKLKTGEKVKICIECENDGLTYFDIIKRNCLIDGIAYDITKQDEKYIENEKKLKAEKDEEDRLMNCGKSIFYFTNNDGKKPETWGMNHSAVKYANFFLSIKESNEEHIQRFRFNYVVGRHWHLDGWNNLGDVNIYLDSYKIENYKARKPGEAEWQDRTRTWYSGRIVCSCDLYNTTFGFATYSNEDNIVNDIYINYQFICSKSYKFARLIKQLLKEDGWKVKE